MIQKLFQSDKRRYCIIRRDESGGVFVELYKQPNVQSTQPPLEIRKTMGATNKKGKAIVQLFSGSTSDSSSNEKPVLVLSPENESESTFWVLEIDRALAASSREDTLSIGDSRDANSVMNRNAADTESIGSDGSGGSCEYKFRHQILVICKN